MHSVNWVMENEGNVKKEVCLETATQKLRKLYVRMINNISHKSKSLTLPLEDISIDIQMSGGIHSPAIHTRNGRLGATFVESSSKHQ